VLKSKIHGGIVTDANVEYEGSVSIDSSLMEMSGIKEYEAVHIWNKTRGTRLVTYAISAPPNSGTICLNGAAALQNKVGDSVIIAAFRYVNEEEYNKFQPRVVFVDAKNKPVRKQGI